MTVATKPSSSNLGSFHLGLRSLALATLAVLAVGCGDDPAPGAIDWSVKHHNSLAAGTDTLTDVKGVVYACLFNRDPFASKAEVVAFQSSGGQVDLYLPEAKVEGTQPGGVPAFPDLDSGKTYTLLIMMDDDNSNAVKECVDEKGVVQISDRDPFSLTRNIVIEPGITDPMTGAITNATRIDALFDQRYGGR